MSAGNQPDAEGAPQETAASPAGDPTGETSGVDNFLEEGAPLEPVDLDEPAPDAADDAVEDTVDDTARQLAERTADLQRLQAEYVNYKRRVDRDRDLVQQNAVFTVLNRFLPVLDDLDRAREHGELEGGFKAVADALERAVADLGLTKFGTRGDAFDPTLHEALMHGHSPDVTTTSVDQVAQAGYRFGDRVVRAAKVTVLDPEE